MDGRAEDHLAEIRDAVRSIDPQVPVFGVKTMEQRLAETFVRQKFYRTAIWMFAGFALLLAVIGMYGIVSYAVVQRTQEITPTVMNDMLGSKDKEKIARVTQAFLKMKKFDIDALIRAYEAK